MPKHIRIEGSLPLAAPKDWDAERDGPCEDLYVLVEHPAKGYRSYTSAYLLTAAEAEAMTGGGALFLRVLGAEHPPISMWVQAAGSDEVVGHGLEFEMLAEPIDGLAARTADPDLIETGWKAMLAELELQAEDRSNAPEIGEADSVGQIWMKGMFAMRAALEVAVEAMGIEQHKRRGTSGQPSGTATLPVMTLGSVAAEHQARRAIEHAEDDGA